VTAFHCVDGGEDAFNIVLGSDENERIPSEVLLVDPDNDLALLRANDRSLPEGLSLAGDAPGWGDAIVIVGHPFGLGWTLTEGIVSHPSRFGGLTGSMMWVQITALADPGYSGAPVLDDDGAVVGIVSFGIGRGVTGAAHLQVITALLERYHGVD
jgi:serine protease Do